MKQLPSSAPPAGRTAAICAFALAASLAAPCAQADETSLRASRHLSASSIATAISAGVGERAPLPETRLPQGALALDGAVRLAVQRHPAIADAIASLRQQSGGIDVARAGYYPSLRVGMGSGASQNAGSSLANVSLSQMLYDFGKVSSNVDQAEAQMLRQQAVVLKQIDSVSQQTAEAVVMAHRYQDAVATARDYVEAVRNVLDIARARADAGLSTQADPIQAQSRLDGARANLLQTEALQRQWLERLRTLLGGPVSGVIAPLPEGRLESVPLAEMPDLRLLPDVLQAEADRRVAAAQLAQARAQRWPTISVDASVDKAVHGFNPATMERNGLTHSLRVNLTSTLYQGGALDAQVRAAAAAEDAAQQRIETARLNVGDQLRSLREQAAGARDRLDVLAARQRGIVQVRDLYREQYTLGKRSILDLLSAEQEIFQAVSDAQGVRHDLWASMVGFVGTGGLGRAFYGLDNTTVQGMELTP